MLSINSKLAKSKFKTFNFNIPALVTCPNAGACAIGCYATMGRYRMGNVKTKQEERLEATRQDDFIDKMNRDVRAKKAERVRIHDSGDMYDLQYFLKWMQIAGMNPNVTFYTYTKMISMFERYAPFIPKNFKYVYSFGGKQDHLIDVEKHRHSKVFQSVEELEAAGYANASEQDDVALESNHRIGLVYHGNKKFTNTRWSTVA